MSMIESLDELRHATDEELATFFNSVTPEYLRVNYDRDELYRWGYMRTGDRLSEDHRNMIKYAYDNYMAPYDTLRWPPGDNTRRRRGLTQQPLPSRRRRRSSRRVVPVGSDGLRNKGKKKGAKKGKKGGRKTRKQRSSI